MGARLAQQLHSVAVRQAHIAHDEVKAVLRQSGPGGTQRGDAFDALHGPRKEIPKQGRKARVIVHHKDALDLHLERKNAAEGAIESIMQSQGCQEWPPDSSVRSF